MNWKKELQKLEQNRQWDDAIKFMQHVIANNPDDKNAYIFTVYLLINLLSEEEYNAHKDAERWALAKKYFKESYAKFSEDAAYVYFMACIASFGSWLLDIDKDEHEAMFEKALLLDRENLLYREPYFCKKPYFNAVYYKESSKSDRIEYRKILLTKNNPIEQQLREYGALGSYLLKQKRASAESYLWER